MVDPEISYMKNTPNSAGFWKQASKVIPGGVTANIKLHARIFKGLI